MADHDDAIDALVGGLAQLNVQEQLRPSNDIAFPPHSTVYAILLLIKKMTNCSDSTTRGILRNSCSFFGVPPIVIAKAWELIEDNETLPHRRFARKEHLLWALHYMKQYPDLNTLSTTVKFDDDVKRPAPKTVTKWVWILVSAIANLDTYVIKWENRKINDVYNDCLVSVDGIDCKFQQMKYYDKEEKKYRINKALGSYKFKYAGLRYEVALALSSNHIVWINGPFLPGDWVDIAIFRQGLVDKLDENERVEADDGYRGEAPKYVRCPCSMECVNEPDTEALQKRLQGRPQEKKAVFLRFSN